MKKIDRKFYYKSFRPDRQISYLVIASLLWEAYDPKSIIDFGCGLGWLLWYFKTRFMITDIMGIEPNPEIQYELRNELNKYIYPLSLSEPLFLERKFDMAVSFEAAEHIKAKYSNIIIENIARHSDLVVFSAAHPGQGGYGHLNEQHKEYWIERFEKNGMKLDSSDTETISTMIRKYGCKQWYWENVMIFRREGEENGKH